MSSNFSRALLVILSLLFYPIHSCSYAKDALFCQNFCPGMIQQHSCGRDNSRMLQNTISEGNNAVYAPEIIYKEWKWSSGPDCQSHSPRTENELEYSSPKGPEEVPKWKSFWLIGSSLAAAIFGFLLSWNLFYLHKLWRREAVLPKQELEDTNVKLCNRDFEILKLVMTRGLKEEEFLERFRGLVRSPDSFPPDIIVDIFRMRRAFEYAQLEIKGIGNAPLAKKNCEAESTGLKLTNGNLHGKLSSLLLERASRLESPKKETCKSFQEAISPKEAAVVKESLFDQGFNLGGQISADSDDVMDLSPVRPPPPPPPPPPPTPGISSTFCNPNISKPKIILSKKMKRLHWKRLLFDLRKKSEAPHIWQLSSEQKFDKQLLEEHFSHKVKMKISKSVMPGSNLSKRRICLLDEKRHRQMAIMLRRFPPIEELQIAIKNWDCRVLTRERVLEMLKLFPSEEEFKLVCGVSDQDKLLLDDPEQFVLIVYPLEGLRSKLETWSFILAFDEDAEILLRSMDCLSSALSELMNSSELRIIFGIILSIGNYLNGGTIRGQADGFEVDALRLLSSIKSLDRGFSLLDFIVSVYEMELEHHRSELSSQLSWISEAYSGMSLFDISSKCRALLHGYRPVSLLPISCSETDLFIVQVEKFLDRSIPVITQLGESLEECLSAYQLALNYFCCTNLSPEGKESKEFLHIFTQFVDQVMNSQSLSSLYEFRISTLKIPSPLSRRSSRVEDIYYKSQNSRKSSLSNYYDRVRIPRRFSLPPPRHRRSASDASEEILSLACHLNISPVRCRSKHSRAPMNSSELQGT